MFIITPAKQSNSRRSVGGARPVSARHRSLAIYCRVKLAMLLLQEPVVAPLTVSKYENSAKAGWQAGHADRARALLFHRFDKHQH